MASPTALLNDLYDKLLGGTNPTEAASNTGDIAAMVKYIAANLAGGSSSAVFSTHNAKIGIALGANNVAAAVSTAWPTASKALFVPIEVPESVTIQRLAWFNGATVSGNVDIGIYDEAGNRKGSTGSTSQAGINQWQSVAVSIALTPGRYLIGLAVDNTTATIFLWTSTTIVNGGGTLEQLTAFPLPATATFATPSGNLIPMVAASQRSIF